MKEVAGADDPSAHFHRRSKIHQVHVGMRDANAGGEEMETHWAHFIEVAYKSVGDGADAAESPMDGRHHFAEVRARAGRLVEVLQNEHARFGRFEYVSPGLVTRAGLGSGLFGGKTKRHRVSHHHTKFGKQAADVWRQVTLVARAQVEEFDGVRDRGCAEAAQSF